MVDEEDEDEEAARGVAAAGVPEEDEEEDECFGVPGAPLGVCGANWRWNGETDK